MSKSGQQLAKQLYEEIYNLNRRNDIVKSLNQHVVHELQTHLFDIVKENCYGCIVDHPSQTQHPICLFSSKSEWVEMFLNSALKKLDMYQVMERWYAELQNMDLTRAEKADAYQMWANIKASVDTNKITPLEAFECEWAGRIKQDWENGND